MRIDKKKFWSVYSIDVIVVFLGVTAGFLLNTWREKSSESELQEKYLKSFYDDIKVDKQNLDSLIVHNQKKSTNLLQILNETSMSQTSVSEKQAQQILKEILRIEWFSPSDDTYSDIKNSGNLNLISDYKLRRAVTSYYKLQVEVEKGEQYYLDHMNNYVFPFLYNNYIMHKRKFISKTSYQSLKFSNTYIALMAFINQNVRSYITLKEKNAELNAQVTIALN